MKLKVVLEQPTKLNPGVENGICSKEYVLKEIKGSKVFKLEETLLSSPPVEFEGTFKEAADVIAITNLTYTNSSSLEEEPQCGMEYIKEVLAAVKKYNNLRSNTRH